MSEIPNVEEEEKVKAARRESRADIAAYFIDTWAISTWRGHVRVWLGEELYDVDAYRAAFVMEADDAEKFANHLLRLVAARKAKDAAKAAPPDPAQSET